MVQQQIEARPGHEQAQEFHFPEGIAFDGNDFVRTAATARALSYLQPLSVENERLVDQTGIEPVTS